MITHHSAQARGVALISVLALLVLITALIVGFLVRAGYEGIATRNYRATATTRLLADTAVNLVQAEINEATTPIAGDAWASQPGAIRVFDNTGALKKIFRLYSAASLEPNVTNPALLANDLPPSNWADSPSHWVDLNAPVKVSAMSSNPADDFLVFPILDPRDPANSGTTAKPIVTSKVPGFSISGAPGAVDQQPAPMPVRWMYVLQNGQILSPDISSSGKLATFELQPPSSRPTSTNPIVGRIAFWTDDETSKVNLNTAAGSFSEIGGVLKPAPWDTPRFRIWDERMLFSENQPVQAEYQRYPGHPATTDLYRIFKALGIQTSNYPYPVTNYALTPQPVPTSTVSGLFKMLPRYADDNSSQGGFRTTTKSGSPAKINGGVAKRARLYTSVGELLFDPDRGENVTPKDGTISRRQQIESGKFFLTAHSVAPEVTLYGTPRIAMWPVDLDPSKRTAFDQLIAFCASTRSLGNGRNPYYFQRSNPWDPKQDYDNILRNQNLFIYLQGLTSQDVPGYGGSFNAKYAVNNERDQILTEMLDYIRCTNLYDHSKPTSDPFPRYTPSGAGKAQVAPLEIEQPGGIITRGMGRTNTVSEIGVLIVCTADGNSPLGPYQTPVKVAGADVSPLRGSANDPQYVSNLPSPQYLRDNTAAPSAGKIIGWDDANKTITTGTESSLPSTGGPFPANPTLSSTGEYGATLVPLLPGERTFQAMLLFEIASPSMGFDPMSPSYRITVNGIQGISLGGQSPFPNRTSSATGANTNGNGSVMGPSGRFNNVQNTGGLAGFRYFLTDYQKYQSSPDRYTNYKYNAWSGQSPNPVKTQPYRYVSQPFKLTEADQLSLQGGFRFDLEVMQGSFPKVYQTFNVDFPAATLPKPDLVKNGLSGSTPVGTPFTSVAADWWGFDKRIAWSHHWTITNDEVSPKLALGSVIRADAAVTGTWSYATAALVSVPFFSTQASSSDVVRTLVAKDGDYRLVAATRVVEASGANSSVFEKGPGYDDSTKKLGNLFKDQGTAHGTAGCDTGGKLVEAANYAFSLVPKVPSRPSGWSKRTSWDWDSGLPAEPDGAYINKPDEGNTYVSGGSSPYYNRETQVTVDIASYFTANRIVTSSVMFGSLPTGVREGISWRTLLFRPSPVGNRSEDAVGVKDHLFLDLFSMPVVEPYAISEPFSTAGKVNMNYQILPFTYIHRSTAVQSVLGSELVARVPKAAATTLNPWTPHSYYKVRDLSQRPTAGNTPPAGAPLPARLSINLSETDGTLRQFAEKFQNWEIFRSASEICDIYLVPSDPLDPARYQWPTFGGNGVGGWYGDDFALVGDNVRERPYAGIYPRLTTKSNSFTVHYTVQSLKNTITPTEWNENRGVVTGEFRGSTTVVRFIDPNNSNIPDYATDPAATSLENYYQWRVVSNNAFAP